MRRTRSGASFSTLKRRAAYGGRKGHRARIRIAALNWIVIRAARFGGDIRTAVHDALGWVDAPEGG